MSRQERVAEAIKKEASLIIHDELKDPRLGFVTITRVEVTPNLRQAKIFFSVLGKEEDYKKTREALDSSQGFIRRLIAQSVRLRLAPEIIFKEDRSSEYSVRIQEVLDEINPVRNTEHTEKQNKISNGVKEPRPSSSDAAGTNRKEGQGEPKKSNRLHKKK